MNVQLPKTEESIKVEANTQLKVKQLKELIKEKAKAALGEINVDRI